MGQAAVLAYHAVSPYPNPLSVDIARLRHQVRRMLRKGFRPVTFGMVADGSAPPRSFAVTFDDGFRSVYDRARPVLAALGVTATVFLPTSRMGRDEPLAWPGLTPSPMPPEELQPMSWDQVRDLVELGWEVGSHTLTHPKLTQVDDRRLATELQESKRVCEDQTGTLCRTLAYPFGDADGRVVQAALDAGYVGAVTMSRLSCVGTLAVPRIGVYSHDTAGRFALKSSPLLRSPVGAAALSRLHGVR